MELSAAPAKGAAGGILAFLRGTKTEEKPPLQVGDNVATQNPETQRGISAGTQGDLRGLGIGRNLDVNA